VSDVHATIEEIQTKCRHDHASWINGDPSGYVIPEDGTLMGAFGGTTRGGAITAGRQRSGSSMWESGTGTVELINGGACDEVAWLVMVERASVKFVDRTEPTRWELRVTELFRKGVNGWERFHRHADPLVDGHHPDEVRALLAST
jgi:hypothetical protein